MDQPLHIPALMAKSDFKKIYENVQYIIVGAYDSEGYVFWEKNKDNLK
jgi:hypothetical protein